MGETRTISSRGGTVAVRYLDGTVRLLWARPDSGYDVEVADDGPDKVLVRFRSDRARSWVYAYYEDGKPAEAVIERGGGKGKDDDPQPKGDEPSVSSRESSQVDSDSRDGDGTRWRG
ncbi:MAG: hypothetical protein M3357_13795 [Actinomycetota bacterium]|nr:hypothetical protein [Actinomycetota bacterium]